MFLLQLLGLFLLRTAQRTFLALLLKAPPRTTRVIGPALQYSSPFRPRIA